LPTTPFGATVRGGFSAPTTITPTPPTAAVGFSPAQRQNTSPNPSPRLLGSGASTTLSLPVRPAGDPGVCTGCMISPGNGTPPCLAPVIFARDSTIRCQLCGRARAAKLATVSSDPFGLNMMFPAAAPPTLRRYISDENSSPMLLLAQPHVVSYVPTSLRAPPNFAGRGVSTPGAHSMDGIVGGLPPKPSPTLSPSTILRSPITASVFSNNDGRPTAPGGSTGARVVTPRSIARSSPTKPTLPHSRTNSGSESLPVSTFSSGMGTLGLGLMVDVSASCLVSRRSVRTQAATDALRTPT